MKQQASEHGIFKYLQSPEGELRQAALYGIGVLAQTMSPDAFASQRDSMGRGWFRAWGQYGAGDGLGHGDSMGHVQLMEIHGVWGMFNA